MPDVSWPHFFASVGRSSDNPVLTAHFPVPAGRILCLPFMTMRSLALECLPELQSGPGLPQKICSSYPRLTPPRGSNTVPENLYRPRNLLSDRWRPRRGSQSGRCYQWTVDRGPQTDYKRSFGNGRRSSNRCKARPPCNPRRRARQKPE